jgi:Arc/MetJ family transcription regulator
VNISMDEALYRRLRAELPLKRTSAFVNEAVRARLQPDRAALDAAHRAASKERWRRKLARDWTPTETEDWPE